MRFVGSLGHQLGHLFFDLCFVKIVTMFKLQVILFIIKLYARDDILKIQNTFSF